jgi:hypothetical protein
MRYAGRALLLAAALSSPATLVSRARADGPQDPRTQAESDLRDYYGGERLSASVIGGLGAAGAASGAYLVTRDATFPRSLGWSWVGVGGLELVGAIGYLFQVDDEIGHYEAALGRDPESYRTEEADHMRGTTSRFVIYRSVELAMVLGGAGALVYGAAANADAWKGAGLGVLTLSLPLAVIDTINNTRASRYLDSVERLHPAIGVQGGERAAVYTMSVGGVF